MLSRLKIGTTDDLMPIYVAPHDRYLHTTLFGKSGTGKSTLLLRWWAEDSLYPISRFLIEPHGELARQAFSFCRSSDIYCSLDHPVGFNLMKQDFAHQAITDAIFDSLNQCVEATTNTERLTANMRVIGEPAIKSCLAKGERSLLDVRDHISRHKGDALARNGLLTRLNFLLSDDRFNEIIAGPLSVDLMDVILNGRSIIFDGSNMSEDKLVFAGTLLLQAMKLILRHSHTRRYKPIVVVLDEAQLFLSPTISSILKEGRKFRLSAICSTQDLISIRDSRIARQLLSVGNLLAFRINHGDAQKIAPEMGFQSDELQFLRDRHLAFATPRVRGIACAPRPLSVRYRPLPRRAAPNNTAPQSPSISTPNTTTMTRHPLRWFDISPLKHPYQPSATLTVEAVPAEAPSGAETPPSGTSDG